MIPRTEDRNRLLRLALSESVRCRWRLWDAGGRVKIDGRNYRIAPNNREFIQGIVRSHATEPQRRFLDRHLWSVEFDDICQLWLWGYSDIDNVVIQFEKLTQREATVASLIF